MKGSNYLRWFRRLAILGAVVAGVTASSAAAVPMLDPGSSPAVSHTTALGVRADGLRLQAIAQAYQQSNQSGSNTTALGVRADGLRLQAIAKAYQSVQQAPAPDVVERYVATHPAVGTDRIVDDSFRDQQTPAPDVVERYVATHPAVGTDRIVDDSFRDPKPVVTPAAPGVDRIVDDSFRDTARYVPATSSGNSGLDWGDFGIGAGAMLALALLVTGVGIGALTMRHRAGKLGTS